MTTTTAPTTPSRPHQPLPGPHTRNGCSRFRELLLPKMDFKNPTLLQPGNQLQFHGTLTVLPEHNSMAGRLFGGYTQLWAYYVGLAAAANERKHLGCFPRTCTIRFVRQIFPGPLLFIATLCRMTRSILWVRVDAYAPKEKGGTVCDTPAMFSEMELFDPTHGNESVKNEPFTAFLEQFRGNHCLPSFALPSVTPFEHDPRGRISGELLLAPEFLFSGQYPPETTQLHSAIDMLGGNSALRTVKEFQPIATTEVRYVFELLHDFNPQALLALRTSPRTVRMEGHVTSPRTGFKHNRTMAGIISLHDVENNFRITVEHAQCFENRR